MGDFDELNSINPDEIEGTSRFSGNPQENSLDYPRIDLFQGFRLGGRAIAGVLLPVAAPCVDVWALHANCDDEIITLEYSGMPSRPWKQITMRLFQRGEDGQMILETTHSWFSDEKEVFENLLKIVRTSIINEECPLWNIARLIEIPARFLAVLGKEIGGDLVSKNLSKQQVEMALSMGFCTIENYLEVMGCRPSPYVRVRPWRFRHGGPMDGFQKGVQP